MTVQYRNNDRINELECDINIVYGERSNGKTYPTVVFDILKHYLETSEQGAYVRRWEEDIKQSKGDELFSGCIADGWLEKETHNKWNDIRYYAGKWYLQKRSKEDPTKVVRDIEPFCYAFSLNAQEHYKSTTYPNITRICFDEFLTRGRYLPDEFVLWNNLLSTIIRKRSNVKIYMLGNTVSKYSPYFEGYKIDIHTIAQGEILQFTYQSGLKIAVEYADSLIFNSDNSSKFFDIGNSQLDMIHKGVWETKEHPKLPKKYRHYKDYTSLSVYFKFNNQYFTGEVIRMESKYCIYVHKKTSPLKYKRNDIIFTDDINDYFKDICNIHLGIKFDMSRLSASNQRYKIEYLLKQLIETKQICYQNNDIGEAINSFIINTINLYK